MDNQYKLPNSNDGCMWLRAPTACPEWNEGTEDDEKPVKPVAGSSKHLDDMDVIDGELIY